MGKHSAFNKMISAPAAMILAAAVTTAVSSAAPVTAQAQPALPTLTWMLNAGAAGASVNACGARAFLAHRAATQIRELDRATCAAPDRMLVSASECGQVSDAAPLRRAPSQHALEAAASSHQHSAP